MSILDSNIEVNLEEYYANKILVFYSGNRVKFYTSETSKVDASQLFIHHKLEKILDHPEDYYLVSLNRRSIAGSEIITYLSIFDKNTSYMSGGTQRQGWNWVEYVDYECDKNGFAVRNQLKKLNINDILNNINNTIISCY